MNIDMTKIILNSIYLISNNYFNMIYIYFINYVQCIAKSALVQHLFSQDFSIENIMFSFIKNTDFFF